MTMRLHVECKKELGIEAPLENALTTWYTVPDRDIRRRIGVYLAKHEGPFELEAIEVAEVVWHKPEEVLAMAKKGEPFQPEFLDMFKLVIERDTNEN
ncbi:MAG: hypothetical protein H6760_00555 [Candidatus Nomurabacteria bacterium]|nr:MAG: hypothetical protein H6760_00555 [Candidatus Nomurabacteria bacterium]